MVHHIPDEMTYEQGALVEPAAVAVHAVRQSKLKKAEGLQLDFLLSKQLKQQEQLLLLQLNFLKNVKS